MFSICAVATTFVAGYFFIICEKQVKISRSAVALLTAVCCWVFLYLLQDGRVLEDFLSEKLSLIAELVFFLLGAMVVVELMDSHGAFNRILGLIKTQSKTVLLVMIAFFSFFLSAVLDNLTTMILMISLLRKLFKDPSERFVPLCLCNLAANAGGVWTPIGDVTTTMLWIRGNITTGHTMISLILPSLVAMCLPLFIFMASFRGKFVKKQEDKKENPGSRPLLFLCLGIGALIFVPLFKTLTGLPPYFGMLFSVGVLWLVSDLFLDEKEHHYLQVPAVLRRIDLTSILFFIGILLAVDALQAAQILQSLSLFFQKIFGDWKVVATMIGLMTSIIGNVPIVAATMDMFSLEMFPQNHPFWLLLAYAAGTGGSIFIIGSAAGIALMSLEKIDFFAYARKVAIPALIGFLGGISLFFLFFA